MNEFWTWTIFNDQSTCISLKCTKMSSNVNKYSLDLGMLLVKIQSKRTKLGVKMKLLNRPCHKDIIFIVNFPQGKIPRKEKHHQFFLNLKWSLKWSSLITKWLFRIYETSQMNEARWGSSMATNIFIIHILIVWFWIVHFTLKIIYSSMSIHHREVQ